MTCDQLRIGTSHGIICSVPEFKRGDPPPNDESYLAWEEWAQVQYKAGLRQSQCGHCGKWRFPVEMSGKTIDVKYEYGKYGQEFTVAEPICKQCDSEGGGSYEPGAGVP